MSDRERDARVDALLLSYLERDEKARQRGITVEAIYDAQTKLANAHAAHEARCDMRWEKNADQHTSTGARLATVEARMVSLVDSAEITGEHAVDAIRAAAEAKGMATAKVHPLRRSHDHPWWRRALDTTAVKAVAVVLAAAGGWLIRHLAGGGH